MKKELQEEGGKQSSFFRIFKEARPEWGYLTVAFLASVVGGAIMPAFSFLLGEIMNVSFKTHCTPNYAQCPFESVT